MERTREEIELLKELGYDPDDPTYVVESYESNDEDDVTATETIEEGITALKITIQEAIDALQRVQDLIK